MFLSDVDIAVVATQNDGYRRSRYIPGRYQLLHGVKYNKKLVPELISKIREKYTGNCTGAAYELKTYYMENGIQSNTIVLKMRPESDDMNTVVGIKIPGYEGEYSHHTIEVFVEYDTFKVLDVLHRDGPVLLEAYLDKVCRVNNCPRSQLRYDSGYLAPMNAYAPNMGAINDLLMYLDKVYGVGKPRCSLLNVPDEKSLWSSDDVAMDFEDMASKFGMSKKDVMVRYYFVMGLLNKLRCNMLFTLSFGYALGMQDKMLDTLLDDTSTCMMLETMPLF